MGKLNFLVALIATSFAASSFALHAAQHKQLSGINKLTFINSAFNKDFVGNGFLISYQDTVYAVTVKHALLEAKTPDMTSVSTDGHISEWQIKPNNGTAQPIILGPLLNENIAEKIDISVLSKDWLVFNVEQESSFLTPLKLRTTPLEAGEVLSAYGCSYANKQSCKQDVYSGRFLKKDGQNLRMQLTDLELSQMRGLSGSPVVDKNNQLVGIVSNVLPSETGKGLDFAPATTEYLIEVLSNLSTQ